MPLFRDRADAGRRLARFLTVYAHDPSAIVLALPRGGVPVAYEVAISLQLPLDVYIVRKLGVPGHEELAMGAVTSDGKYIFDERTMQLAGVTEHEFQATLARELAELRRREIAYRGDRSEPEVAGKTVLLVDDGLATGSSMQSAVGALRQRNPAAIVVAVPVAPPETVAALARAADQAVALYEPWPFYAVGTYYTNFEQVEDGEVRALLSSAEKESRKWKVA
ncbi:MAG TPA: phosphoribosyltransferase family protein [Candidatus Acidoferrales bacterium]|nr:phosphoribosyltransferase family protein [Candidatus Acidoferrales bacterium]